MEKEKEEKVEEERVWRCVKEAEMGDRTKKDGTYEGARREVASAKEPKNMSSRWRSLSSKSYYLRLFSRTQPHSLGQWAVH